jgi:hypothetical protein
MRIYQILLIASKTLYHHRCFMRVGIGLIIWKAQSGYGGAPALIELIILKTRMAVLGWNVRNIRENHTQNAPTSY